MEASEDADPKKVRVALDVITGIPDGANAVTEVARVAVGDVGVVAGVAEVEVLEEHDAGRCRDGGNVPLAREAAKGTGERDGAYDAQDKPRKVHAARLARASSALFTGVIVGAEGVGRFLSVRGPNLKPGSSCDLRNRKWPRGDLCEDRQLC